MLALKQTGLAHEQAKLLTMKKYSKAEKPYESKRVRKAARIAATNLNVPLLQGTVQKRRRRV